MLDRSALRERPTEEVVDAYEQLCGVLSGVLQGILACVSVLDERRVHEEDGATSTVAWMQMRSGLSQRTAREWVRAARALDGLPAVDGVLAEGRLSWDQVRPLTAVAAPETDERWASEAPGFSAAELERAARRARRVRGAETEEAVRTRSLRFRWDHDRDQWRLWGRLPSAEGAKVLTAVERLAEQVPPDPDTGQPEPFEARCADALVELAGVSLAADGDPDRATVVVHVDAPVLVGGPGAAEVQQGPVLDARTAQRLACDARLQLVGCSVHGRPVGFGRVTRIVPPALARLVLDRHPTCVWPGCDRSCWLQIHHIVPWALGGRTDLENLVPLCFFHHRAVHEGGWRIEGTPDDLRFVRPGGEPLSGGPVPMRSEVRDRIFGPPSARRSRVRPPRTSRRRGRRRIRRPGLPEPP